VRHRLLKHREFLSVLSGIVAKFAFKFYWGLYKILAFK